MEIPRAVRAISPEELRKFMAEHEEGAYTLVDVRQPQEYRQEHLPGAQLIPVSELETRLGELPAEQDLVFYCKSGARSAAAALIAQDSGVIRGSIMHLHGGILAWEGGSIGSLPRVEVFAGVRSASELLMKALELEKAAHTMYTMVRASSQRTALCNLMDKLIGVEEAHARMVYRYLSRYWTDDSGELPPFEVLFDTLQGRVLEGGLTVDELEPWIRGAIQGECVELADLALEVELNAYDLYRTLARQAAASNGAFGLGADAELIFLDLASQEKHHARLIMSRMAAFEEPKA
ncbi:rhodanese-like domain-containing protein [Desulfovibrio mangrovi]|uniref:rhodanese-like domain-containing protein n=1 Tax=Desulfovibrio mangrovi TaxID=2976983 RepID=UPI002245A94A|nr:rhodanese-like domain-containing protein [Desulfovibrio mangrovi]UZP66033.1 rhodanese-like domain-containing protein [Desulfovibrio mangrovi]